MTRTCEFCPDDTEGKYYLESEAHHSDVSTGEHVARVLCRDHARRVRAALQAVNDSRESRGAV